MNDKIGQRLHLTLSQLEVFVATAQGGSTRAASERIGRSQSAASDALAELESALNAELFDRVGRRLRINERGRELLPRAVALLEEAGELERLFAAHAIAKLRVAASYTIGEYLMPEMIGQWKARHPQARVQLEIANSRRVLEAVAGFDVDLGFIEGSGTHPDLSVSRWRDDRLVVVSAPDHPLAASGATMESLAQAPWIVREPGSGTREAADRWLTGSLGQMQVEMELGSNEAVKRAVASGLGLGCLSAYAVKEAVAQGTLVELKTPLPVMHRALSIVVRRQQHMGPTARAFVCHAQHSESAQPSGRHQSRGV